MPCLFFSFETSLMPPLTDMPDPLYALLTVELSPTVDAVMRLIWAAICGALVGLERESRGHEAGFRTCLLVSLGSAVAVVTSIAFAAIDWDLSASGDLVRVDPARIAYGVMGGVGFLGAGTIIKSGLEVRGLTTAATVWCVAAIGLAAGTGMYFIAGAAAVLVLITLTFLDVFEHVLPQRQTVVLILGADWHPKVVERAVALCKEERFRAARISVHNPKMGKETRIRMELRRRYRKGAVAGLMARFTSEQEFRVLAIEPNDRY